MSAELTCARCAELVSQAVTGATPSYDGWVPVWSLGVAAGVGVVLLVIGAALGSCSQRRAAKGSGPRFSRAKQSADIRIDVATLSTSTPPPPAAAY